MKEEFKIGDVDEKFASQIASDQQYIQKLLSKDKSLKNSWEEVNNMFDVAPKKDDK